MPTITSYTTTNQWTELQGVSTVSDIFTLQNKGSEPLFICQQTTPSDADSKVLNPTTDVEATIDNLNSSIKTVWVRSVNPVLIAISKRT
jgi:hypothetical protein